MLKTSGIFSEFPVKEITGSKIIVTLIYIGVYLKDIGSLWFPEVVSMVFIGTGLALGITLIWLKIKGQVYINTLSLEVFVIGIFIWLLTILATFTPNSSSYYLAIPCAFVLLNTAPRYFMRLMIAHLACSLAIQCYEYFTGDYFYIYKASDGDLLDELLFGGSMGIMRAKGLFQGPLSAVAFSLWMAFLNKKSATFAAALLFSAFFASGRLGITVGAIYLAGRIFIQNRELKSNLIAFVVGIAIVLGLIWYFVVNIEEERLYFILAAFDTESSQNTARAEFWKMSLDIYLSSDPIHLIFGNFGYVAKTIGGTENDFLRLLLDDGIIGFILYVFPIVGYIYFSLKYRIYGNVITGFIIILLMNSFPFIQSLSSSVLFWIFMFYSLSQFRKDSLSSNTSPRLISSISL